jgi:hypothetical protein
MDVKGMWKFAGRLLTRSMLAGAAICMLLTVAVIWSARQSRLTNEALDRATAAERATAQVRSDLERSQDRLRGKGQFLRDPAVRRSRHDNPKEIERVNQLYAEIENLSHVQERIGTRLGSEPMSAPKSPEAAPGQMP